MRSTLEERLTLWPRAPPRALPTGKSLLTRQARAAETRRMIAMLFMAYISSKLSAIFRHTAQRSANPISLTT